ncbi:MAG: LysR family transcriptional regulator [Gemmatimonadota bacterium]|nr:LysR family transcriptional regulator [Gemmatimonadota bacterium]
MLTESLKVFCDLIETQSFSKTALLNDVSQSAVSQQLKSIEKRQGRQLVQREKRRLSLTAEGEVFYGYAREIVRRFDEMQHRLQALSGEISGTVRLSAIYSVGMMELAAFLKTYIKGHPKVNLRLSYTQARNIYDNVASGQIDLGVVAFPRSQRNVDAVQFAEDPMVVICSVSNPLSVQPNVSPGELAEQRLILFTPEFPTRTAVDRYFRKHGVNLRPVMELDHIATLIHAVEVDIGISLVPSSALRQGRFKDTLRALPLRGKPLIRTLGVLQRKGRSHSMATRKLFETLTGANL